MKLAILSDIHGAATQLEHALSKADEAGFDRIVLLGDILYHGPRNDLPKDYNPKACIELLNARADKIIAVRGNCEAEVDQMVLKFPVLADYNTLLDKDHTLFFTHGHIWGPGLHNSVDHWPKLPEGSFFFYGHTHKKVNTQLDEHPGVHVVNPGSVGIPKDGSASFGIYQDGTFEHVLI